jgi:hypothetical protein
MALARAVAAVTEGVAEVRDARQREAFDGSLKPDAKLHLHQEEAVRFGMCLHPRGFILADDMGLGKTLSLLALCSWIKSSSGGSARFLIVAPLSVAPNWMTEIARFTTFAAVLLIGNAEEREERLAEWKRGADVLVTTYEHAREPRVLKAQWTLLAVDEGHRLQNRESQLYKALFGTASATRVLLTGTPMQNKLDELYSLLHFVAADVFDSSAAFLKESGDTQALHALLRVFMLRRLKKDVNLGLPPRVDLSVSCPMSDLQRKVYVAALQRNWAALGPQAGGKSLSNVLMNLRKATAHPYLFDGVEPQLPSGEYEIGEHIVRASGKLRVLDVLLRKLRREGSKVLLFSTMTRVLDILQDYLDWRKLPNVRLDGSVRSSDRTQAIDDFKNAAADSFVFLLSTRAGGVGLNLANANCVIFFDSDWNPMADMQAAARAHRLGQLEEVLVIRLVARGTVDEMVVSRAQSKLALADAVVDQGRAEDPKFTAKELLDIVAYGVADMLEQTDEGAELTEEDIEEMIADARQQAQRVQGEEESKESLLKRSKTIKRLGTSAAEADGDMYEFEGKNWASERDAQVLQKLAEEGKKETAVAQTPPRAATAGGASLTERATRSADRARDSLKAMWEKNGYVSLKVEAPEEPEQNDSYVADEVETELHHVVGDCTECSEGGKGRKIVIVCCNRSGVFGASRFFEAVLQRHGREALEGAYERAHENKDLATGDCHIVPSALQPGCFVALCICIDKSGELLMPALKRSLQSLAAFARREPNTTLHCPHLLNWYASERVLQSALCSAGCQCYVYYWQRKPQQQPQQQQQPAQQQHQVLPDFLRGVKLHFAPGCDPDGQLWRHAVAYGATIADARADDVLVVAATKPAAGPGMVLATRWLVECFRRQQLVDQEPFLLL